jgi:hypothetical protein
VHLENGVFAIENVLEPVWQADVQAQLTGDASGFAELADAKHLLALRRWEITPSDLAGAVRASVAARMPVREDIVESEVDWNVALNARGVSSKAPLDNRTLSDGDLAITASRDGLSIKGKAKIDGVPTEVALVQPLSHGDTADGPGERTARLTLDDAARKRLAMNLDQILSGPVEAQVTSLPDGGEGEHYDLDLRRARLVMPGLDWSKAAGVPATLTFDIKPADGGYSVENMQLDGAGFGFAGTAKLDGSYGLISADLDQFALHEGDSLACQLTRTRTGYRVVAHGASFDVKGILNHLENGGDYRVSSDVAVDARISRVIGFNQEVVASAHLGLASGGGYLHRLDVTGTLDGADLNFAYSDNSEGSSLLAAIDDAGSVLRFINVYSRVDGGRLSITGERAGNDGRLAGTFQLTSFDVRKEPATSQAASTRAAAPATHVDSMTAHFQKVGDRISIADALVRGPRFGATFNGGFDLAESRLAVSGTFIPAYELNNAVGHIPVLGCVLANGERGGVLGVTFRVDGPLSGPYVRVNPLSVVAPGILRRIFEFH